MPKVKFIIMNGTITEGTKATPEAILSAQISPKVPKCQLKAVTYTVPSAQINRSKEVKFMMIMAK